MDLISRLRNAKLNVKHSNNPEIVSLKKTNLTSTLNRGFTEVYRANPSDPIEFLSKWLYKESKANELRVRYADDKRKRDNACQRYKERKLKEQEQQNIKNAQIQEHINKQNALLTTIDTCECHWITFNEVCERLKSLVNASGCYLAVYDLRRKEVTEDDDELGHIHPSNTNVIRYIAWCNDHAFLHGQCLEPNSGVTYNLLLPRQQQVNANPQGESGGDAGVQEEGGQVASQQVHRDERKEEAEGIESLLIDDVINDNRIKFYKEPRLGCYYAVDITYKSSLSYASLKSAMQATKEYLENKEKQDERYKEWKEKKEQKEKELEELRKQAEKEAEEKRKEEEAANAEGQAQEQQQAQGDGDVKKQEIEQQQNTQDQQQQQQNVQEQLALENEIEEWKEEPVKLADYDKEDKKLILCLDTLGQDRTFTEDEFKYIITVCKSIKTSLETYEQRLLEKDRDSKIKFDENETKLKLSDLDEDKFYENADNAITAYYESDEFKELKLDENDPRRVIEGNSAKARYIRSQLLEGSVLDVLKTFSEWEFVEYEKVFQNLFYFAQAEPVLINEPETNKIEWTRARKYWHDVFPYIYNYNPRGAKPDRLRSIHKLNKIKENLELAIAKRDEVKSYSYTLLLLVDYVLLLIKIRYDDIVQRNEEVTAFKAVREQIIKDNEEIEAERNKIIEEAKQAEEAQKALLQQQQQQQGGEGESNQVVQEQQQQQQEGTTVEGDKTGDDNGLEEILRKFDEEYPKKEVPEDRDYDYDFDYDIK